LKKVGGKKRWSEWAKSNQFYIVFHKAGYLVVGRFIAPPVVMNIHAINCIPDALFECAGFIVPRCRFASVMVKWDYWFVPVAVASFCFLHWYSMLLSRAHSTIEHFVDQKGELVTDEGNGTLEIQNLATDERYQRQGYALKLINHIAEHYKGQYNKIILGTGDVPGILEFYERRGFAVTHRLPDYFTENYDHPMIEDGVLLKDKVYLERKVNK